MKICYFLDILEVLCVVLKDNYYFILWKEKGIMRSVLFYLVRCEFVL